MAVVSAPTTSQYNFQYITDEESRLVPLKEVKEKIEAGEKIRVKVKIKKGSKVESVGNRGLRMLKSTITDGTSTIFLTIWESEIDAIQDSKVYIIDDVKVNFSYVTKTLTTTKNSVFTLVDDDDDMEELTVQEDDSEIQLTIFSDVLGKLVDKPNVNELTEEDISEKLLE
ncbi:Hypothetical predicted protein [Paramuricea clavata]|uniref:Uncharacterized protein n=1 Tax=Paramuricea clavata TaxID=317549 RepID=A0A7D9IJ78_PARCT|nr:Hypothetical predicted protein [Paramuricea clavata]